MFEFNLLKSLYFELDPDKMEGVEVKRIKQKTFHTLKVHYPEVPEITSITAEERILPYLVRYYFYINNEESSASIKDLPVKKVIMAFYREHHPEYLKEDIPKDLADADILDYFKPFEMPNYKPKYAFPGLVTMQDIREGKVKEGPKYAFPGLELYQGHEGKPAASTFNGYTEFKGDRKGAQNKIDQLKQQLSGELEQYSLAQAMPQDTLIPQAKDDEGAASSAGGDSNVVPFPGTISAKDVAKAAIEKEEEEKKQEAEARAMIEQMVKEMEMSYSELENAGHVTDYSVTEDGPKEEKE